MFGFLLFVLGGYLLFKSNWFGLLAILVGLPVFFAKAGIQIDFRQRLYRQYFGVAEVKFGKWQQLPEIDYVTVYVAHYAQRGSVASIDNVRRYSRIKVSLIVSRTERYDAGFFDSREKALNAGLLIARNLRTRLLDYTDREPRWVEFDVDIGQ